MNIVLDTIKSVARFVPHTIRLSTPDTDSIGAMLWITYADEISTQSETVIDPDKPGIATESWGRPADTYHYVNEYRAPQEWEALIGEAGWVLGAGYMYRWHNSPGRTADHLWGTYRYSVGDEINATGDSDPVLAELSRQFGRWEWEINSTWRRIEMVAQRWRDEDQHRDANGCRALPFPGWDGEHPWLRATKPDTGYESHFYYLKPPKYNKNSDVLVKGVL